MSNLNPYRHFFLYAKGHYERGVILEDLGKICTAYLQHDLHAENDRIRILFRATKTIKKSFSVEEVLNEVLNSSIEYNMPFDFETHSLTAKDSLINAALTMLRHCTIDEIEGSLGEADFNILPEGNWGLSKKIKEGANNARN